MGHERIGVLPRTVRWRTIVDQLASQEVSAASTLAIANLTIQNVRRQFDDLADDESVLAAFRFLVALPLATRAEQPHEALAHQARVHHVEDASVIGLCRAFQDAQGSFPATESSDLAARTLADTLAEFRRDPRNAQGHLFGTDPWDPWRIADSGSGFAELARIYLSKLTERYVRYFLDREASAALGTIDRVADFRANLETSIDAVARHAFETSKIAESFGAGWYSKNAGLGMPGEASIRGFLSHALHKLREELRRDTESE